MDDIDRLARLTDSPLRIFAVFLRLGLTGFGGPIAHLAYFREEFVVRRKWIAEQAYVDLVALCQFLPGPASSQVGIALGFSRGGLTGAIASWLGFTLPSAIALVLFGIALTSWGDQAASSWLHGLKVAAVAVVAQALWGMGTTLCPDRQRASIALIAAVLVSLIPGVLGQIGVIVAAGLVGMRWLPATQPFPHCALQVGLSRRTGVLLLGACFALLAALPYLAERGGHAVQLFDSFFRAGALVFGGGHVVLPLLQAETVGSGWVTNETFLAGYGAAQAVPGPLFTFAAYLGAVTVESPSGWLGGTIALVAIFLPAFLLVLGALPLWESLRQHPVMQRAMLGINAAVVGLLLSAFHDPVWSRAILTAADFALALMAFLLLMFWRVPQWLVVGACAVAAGIGW